MLINPLFLRKTDSVNISWLIFPNLLLSKVVGVALDVLGRQLVQLFHLIYINLGGFLLSPLERCK
jgi:hypothetical protein